MSAADYTLVVAYVAAFLIGGRFVGAWLAGVLEGKPPALLRWLRPLETGLYKVSGVDPGAEMDWRGYAGALLVFNLLGTCLLFALIFSQSRLPLNPQGFGPMSLGVAVNTAVSFATNTNWQAYSGESSLGYLVQMVGLGVQNFLSAATGIAVMAALARGFTRKPPLFIGNFWADLVRSTVYLLLPLSSVFDAARPLDLPSGGGSGRAVDCRLCGGNCDAQARGTGPAG